MLAVCAAGGGSRGLLQCGYLQALKDLNIQYDRMYGASVGGLNGLLYYQGDFNSMKNLWMEVKNSDVYRARWNPFSLFNDNASLNDSAPLRNLINRFVDMDKIKANNRPFTIMITNLTKMEPHYVDIRDLSREEIVNHLLASASPPILFQPVKMNNNLFVDAGILTNFGITKAINDGCDTIICMTPTNYKAQPIKSLVDIVQSTISTSSFGYLDREIKAVEKINNLIDMANVELTNDLKKINLLVLRPQWQWDQGLIDFNYKDGRAKLMQGAYDYAYSVLSKWAKGGI